MKFKRYSWLCALLIAATLAPSKTAQASSGYLLVEFRGDVQVKRWWQPIYRPARPGMILGLGDRLRTGSGAQASIQCDDLRTIWSMYSNLIRGVAAGCPSRDKSDLRVGQQNDNAPGGNDSTIPYIISPRRTAVLDSELVLRWNAVPGATSYTVQLLGVEEPWAIEVNGTQATYSGTFPLIPGEDYYVMVEANTGTSSREDAGSGIDSFQVLYPYDVNLVNEEKDNLSSQNLPEEVYALALAKIYIREDLLADAIDTLEPLITENSNNFEVYKVLGDLYRYIGLNSLAKTRYEKAIDLAEINGNLEGKSSSQAGLAEVKLMLGAPQEMAIDLLTEALAGYRVMLENYTAVTSEEESISETDGESDLGKDIQDRFTELEKRIEDVEKRLDELQ